MQSWNAHLSMTWQEYRQLLFEKAKTNWQLPVLRKIPEVLSLGDNDGVVPIDDDDWLHPNIEPFIREELGRNDLLQWTQIVNHCTATWRGITKWGLNEEHRNLVCCTSDHCIRVGALRTCSNVGRVLFGHGFVKERFTHARRLYVPETMSCYNRHFGSTSFLRSIKSIEGISPQPLTTPVPAWAKWAEPLIVWLDKTIMSLFEKQIRYL